VASAATILLLGYFSLPTYQIQPNGVPVGHHEDDHEDANRKIAERHGPGGGVVGGVGGVVVGGGVVPSVGGGFKSPGSV